MGTAGRAGAVAPGTLASYRPGVAADTSGSAARAAPAGPAPRRGGSLRSSDGLLTSECVSKFNVYKTQKGR